MHVFAENVCYIDTQHSYTKSKVCQFLYLQRISIPFDVVVLHMPGLARWLTPGRSLCGSTLFIIFVMYLFILFFFCFFFLLLSLLLLPASSSWGRLPFLAGEVGCLILAGEVDCFFAGSRLPFRQGFLSAWWWCCVHVWGLHWRGFCVLSLT